MNDNKPDEQLDEEKLLLVLGAFEKMAQNFQVMVGGLAKSMEGLTTRLADLEEKLKDIEHVEKEFLAKNDSEKPK
jgi:hypothetical protein